jgi:uncharacterized protein (TIGR03437 family)
MPFEVSGSATVTVTAGGLQTATKSVPLHSTAPGIFLLAQGWAAAVNQDGSVNGSDDAAAPGASIAVYVTGLGAVSPPVATGAPAPAESFSMVTSMVTATLGGQPAMVLFAGLAPGYVGLYQVNLMIPQLAPGNYPLQISANGAASNTATISIR